MGLAIAGALAGHEVKKALIDFNAGVESAKIGLSTMIQGNLGGTWDAAKEKASALYDEFQKFSVMTPVTTSEILTFGKAVAVATFQASGGMQDLVKVTEQGVIAAKAFGYESGYAAMELSHMLSGNVNKRMVFAQQLLGMAHMTEEEFKKLNAEQRLGVVEKVLGSDAMKNAAQEFGKSWAGVTSTLEDKLQITFGRMGKPLFEAMKTEFARWNSWLDENKIKIDEIGHSIADGLVKGFGFVKDALGFLIAHADTLLTIGKVWAAVKIGGMLGNLTSGGAAGGVGMLARAGAWASKGQDYFDEKGGYVPAKAGRGMQAVGGIGGVIGNAGLLAQAGLVGYAVGTAIGLDKVGHSLARLTGLVDESYVKWERLQDATKKVADAMEHAAVVAEKKAAFDMEKSRAVTNVQGMASLYGQAANLLGDRFRAQAAMADWHGPGAGMARMNYTPQIDAQSEDFIRRSAAKLGISVDNLDELTAPQVQAIIANLKETSSALNVKSQNAAVQSQGFWEVGMTALTDYQKRTLNVNEAQLAVSQYVVKELSAGNPANYGTILEIMRKFTDDPTGKHQSIAEKPRVNVTIQRIEVQSDDPDRFAFGLVEAFRDAAKNPSSALAALREG